MSRIAQPVRYRKKGIRMVVTNHAKRRIKERFGLELSNKHILKLIKKAKKRSVSSRVRSNGANMKEVVINGMKATFICRGNSVLTVTRRDWDE
jgi:hypothetical protein